MTFTDGKRIFISGHMSYKENVAYFYIFEFSKSVFIIFKPYFIRMRVYVCVYVGVCFLFKGTRVRFRCFYEYVSMCVCMLSEHESAKTMLPFQTVLPFSEFVTGNCHKSCIYYGRNCPIGIAFKPCFDHF